MRGVHYDCFHVLPKKINDAIKRFGEDPVKNLGINVLRLEFRLWEIEKKPCMYSQTALAHLDETIARLRQNGIMEKGIRFKDLLDEEKRLYLTENFESSQQLRQILENGFKGCLTE